MSSDALAADLNERKQRKLLRELRVIDSRHGMELTIGDEIFINFSSNDYLGLSGETAIAEAASDAPRRWGTGSGASRLVSGSLNIHHRLEHITADFKQEESALVYPSGYQANVGLLSALINKEDVVYCDRLCHASLIDGARLSGAAFKVFAHMDYEALEKRLMKAEGRNRYVVTDAYFSMDGTVADLKVLQDLCSKYEAHLIADEAHSNGIFGKEGRGLSAEYGVTGKCFAITGTYSKSAGSAGGFVAGSKLLTDSLINHSRAFIYSTGISPLISAASIQGLYCIMKADELRNRLNTNTELIRSGLVSMGFDLGNSRGPIIPVIIGDTDQTLKISELLMDQKILAPAIRPPTVPKGTDRIRVTVSAAHTEAHLKKLLKAFRRF